MFGLANMQYRPRRYSREIIALRGLNLSDDTSDGDLAISHNLSARRWPYITTRRARGQQTAMQSGCTALTARDTLIAVRGTDLLVDGAVVGHVTAGEKQFAFVNTKMVIWPDKVMYDFNDKALKPIELSKTFSKVTFRLQPDGETPGPYVEIVLAGGNTLHPDLKAGDTIEISGCTADESRNKSVTVTRSGPYAIVCPPGSFTEGTETGEITIARKVQDMDYICSSQNRLWGCSTKEQTIYASALGDPTNFQTFQGLASDSYAVPVGTSGRFTGCCTMGSSVLFFKEDRLHKVLGSTPAEYAVYDYELEGVRDGSYKSIVSINDMIYYHGIHGVYVYTGGTPVLISKPFGQHDFSAAVGGTDGDSYYLSVKDGDAHRLLVYEVTQGIWMQEDDTAVVDFARIGRDLYFLDGGGTVYLADSRSDDRHIDWTAVWTPFYETAIGRKRYAKLLVRAQVPKGTYIQIYTRFDDGVWKAAGRVIGRDQDVTEIRIPTNRCDKFEVKMSGHGPCCIMQMVRVFEIGGDRG